MIISMRFVLLIIETWLNSSSIISFMSLMRSELLERVTLSIGRMLLECHPSKSFLFSYKMDLKALPYFSI